MDNPFMDGSEKDRFTLEQEDWLVHWNRLGSVSLQSDEYLENQLWRLKKKLLNSAEINQKLVENAQKEKEDFVNMREALEKTIHELQYTKCQKDQLIIERDSVLLQLEEAETKYLTLQNKLEEQSASIKMISQDFQTKLSQEEEIREQLLRDLRNQDANYLNQNKQLEEMTNKWLNLKNEIEKERENMTCPICFHPWEDSGHHRLVSLQCGHLFGFNCISDHLNRLSQLCPICRAPAQHRNLINIYGRPKYS